MKKLMVEGIDYYYNEQSFFVFTEKYHLERGYCCGNGCKHCPYDYEKVAEPRRTALLQQKDSVAQKMNR